ncbi:MAG: xylose isomerase [Oscillospiraceae bacterium]|nr:xylose isomerase [Oscillospiraceae bacterium]
MKEYFPSIPALSYEGSYSSNPFAFKFYDPERIVAGKPMREHLRFSLSYEKAFCVSGADAYGQPTANRHFGAVPAEGTQIARDRLFALMELMHKLGLRYFTMRDRDLAPGADSLRESGARLDEMAEGLLYLQQVYGVRPMQFSADLSSHPRYMNGAATSCSAEVFAFAAAQVKKALETAHRLGALSFCVSGGREGRAHLLCVNEALEEENLARLLQLTADHAAVIGYEGRLCIQPSPPGVVEGPYWGDGRQCLDFLRSFRLDAPYQVTLQEHAALPELRALLRAQKLCSMATLRAGGGSQGGLNPVPAAALALFELLRHGGFQSGGVLLEAAPRRSSNTLEDLCITYMQWMDAYAVGLMLAQRALLDGRLEQFQRDRYASFGYGVGKAIAEGGADMDALEFHALQKGEVYAASARQEYLESMINALLFRNL